MASDGCHSNRSPKGRATAGGISSLASQLWKRTPTRILRELAALTGTTVRELERQVRLAFVKVGETQSRGLIHFHAIVRLDSRPPKTTPHLMLPPPSEFTSDMLSESVRLALPKVLAKAPPAPDGRVHEVRWGSQVDIKTISVANEELRAEAVATYLAKYATKQPEMLAALDRRITCQGDIETLALNDHLRRMVATAWRLGDEDHLANLNLKLWAHQLGFRGHWLTKSRRYSTTFTALRQARLAFRQKQTGPDAFPSPPGDVEVTPGAIGRMSSWRFCGAGYRTHADAWLADTARRRAQEARRALKEERQRALSVGGSHGRA